jgi:hypothetical protein
MTRPKAGEHWLTADAGDCWPLTFDHGPVRKNCLNSRRIPAEEREEKISGFRQEDGSHEHARIKRKTSAG